MSGQRPAYGQHLITALADGILADSDLTWLKSYEQDTFDELCNINPARLPRFTPDGDGGPVGDAT